MEQFTLTELSIASVAILGAVSGCVATILHILFQSRCSDINLCCGLIGCKRKVPDDDIEKQNEKTDKKNDDIVNVIERNN